MNRKDCFLSIFVFLFSLRMELIPNHMIQFTYIKLQWISNSSTLSYTQSYVYDLQTRICYMQTYVYVPQPHIHYTQTCIF